MKEIIALQNPWWLTGKVSEEELGTYKRESFAELSEELKNTKIEGIVGPRQSGKTTLVKELIHYLLEKRCVPERIVYVQFETKKLCREGIIKDVLDLVSERLDEPLREFSKRIYFFLDEVHHFSHWAEELKAVHDLKLNIKFVITGSSSLKILRGSGESLTGRINHHILLPLSFRERITSINLKPPIEIPDLEYRKLKQIHAKLLPHAARIRLQLHDYLLKGGYPEIVEEKNLRRAFKLLRDYKSLTLQRDLFEVEEIRDTKTVSEMVEVLADLVGSRLNYSKLASILNKKMDTAKKYIGLLEDIFLVKELKVFSKKPYFSVRKERKIYFLDNGMVNSLALNLTLSEKKIPYLIENSVSLSILRWLYQYSISPTYFYWVEREETDFIISFGREIIPIEVKYRNNIKDNDIKGLLRFMEKFAVRKGLVVTKNLLEERKINNKVILCIPAWFFLVVC